ITTPLKLSALIPEAILLTLVLLLLVAALFRLKIGGRLTGYLVMTALFVSGISISFTKPGIIGADLFLNEPGAQFFKYLFLSAAFLAVALSAVSSNDNSLKQLNSYTSILLALVGMMFLSMATSLLSLYVTLELSTLPLTALLILSSQTDGRSLLSLRFLIVTVFSSLLILFGFSFLYGLSGALNLIVMKLQIAIVHITNRQIGVIILLSIVAVLTGTMFRLGLIPFHNWARKFQESMPLPIVAFLATGFLAALLMFLAKFFIAGLFAFYGPEMNPNDWGRLLGFVAFVNLIFGSIQLFRQRDLVAVMFYTVITQASFVMMGFNTMRPTGLQAAAFCLSSIIISVIGVYAIIYLIRQSLDSTSLDSVKGLSKSSKLLAILLVIFLMSLAGLPMLSGFVGKFSVLEAALERAGADRTYHWMYLVVGAAMFNIIVSFVKYSRVSLSLFQTVEHPLPSISIPAPLYLILGAALLVTITFGIYPDPLLSFASRIPEAFGFVVE
ncbi:MAG: NADH-quinone oxidoreductase subunit N, partial [Candidatus Zixiibacteriota bacterium]